MYRFASSDVVDLDQLHDRFRRMSDAELLRFGKAAQYMCSPKANSNKPPREPFVIQLEEARAEWRRRHPKTAGTSAV
jgi:hypothetical protein